MREVSLLNYYKNIEQLLLETLVWVLLGRVFFACNHNESALEGLLLR